MRLVMALKPSSRLRISPLDISGTRADRSPSRMRETAWVSRAIGLITERLRASEKKAVMTKPSTNMIMVFRMMLVLFWLSRVLLSVRMTFPIL
ncbi:MAG: hypothetical protein P8163_06190 [Candidatus Thiodiazotropha sp.]